MATDFFGAKVQASAVQKLYLTNSGYNDYGAVIPLISSTIEGLRTANQTVCEQQPLAEFSVPLPPGYLGTPSNTNTLDPVANHASLHGNAWGDANGFPFLPCSGVVESKHTLVSRTGSVNSSYLSQYDVEGLSNSSSYSEHARFLSSAGAARLSADSVQASFNTGQVLSLSLSPQRPILQSQPLQQSNSNRSSCDVNSSFGAQNIRMYGSGFLNQLNDMSCNRLSSAEGRSSVVWIQGSRYMQAAQELLNEVVSVGQGITDGVLKQQNTHSWVGHDSWLTQKSSVSNVTGKVSEHSNLDSAGARSPSVGAANPLNRAVNTDSGCPSSDGKLAELTPAESKELQTKKAKLMAIRDEVDRRYREYCCQMQIVVATFECAAGFGAARIYTALALQTISKHYRSLRDAIGGQIQGTSHTLGEEDVSGQGISRLRFVDQQLRQQCMLRQLGMMAHQNAWRPQRGLPEHSVSILRAWLFEHFLHPYPKDADKIMLARQTGLTRNQVSNWFINARVRLWKPMVEEMYADEVRSEDTQWVTTRSTQNADTTRGIRSPMDDDVTGNAAKRVNAEVNEDGSYDKSEMADGCYSDSHTNGPKQGSKMARIGFQDPHLAAECGISGLNTNLEPHASIHNTRERTQGYNIMCFNGTEAGYGSFQVNTLTHDSTVLSPHYNIAPTGGVSLTLGLQHCDVLTCGHRPAHHEQAETELLHDQGQPGYLSPPESSYLQQHKHFLTQGLLQDFAF